MMFRNDYHEIIKFIQWMHADMQCMKDAMKNVENQITYIM